MGRRQGRSRPHSKLLRVVIEPVGHTPVGHHNARPRAPRVGERRKTLALEHRGIALAGLEIDDAIRDQRITPEQQIAFGRRFGELEAHPLAPHEPGHGELMVVKADEKSARVNGEEWHTDMSAEPRPPLGSILYMKVCPPIGGDTLFASMYAAWDTLSERMKAHLDGLTAMHDGEFVYRGTYAHLGVADRPKYSQSNHPVARTHPVTGRKALYVNRRFTTHINGLPREESDALLGYLFGHLENPLFQCRFIWREGSLAFWDNRCVQHRAMWDYWPNKRYANRVTILGETPV